LNKNECEDEEKIPSEPDRSNASPELNAGNLKEKYLS